MLADTVRRAPLLVRWHYNRTHEFGVSRITVTALTYSWHTRHGRAESGVDDVIQLSALLEMHEGFCSLLTITSQCTITAVKSPIKCIISREDEQSYTELELVHQYSIHPDDECGDKHHCSLRHPHPTGSTINQSMEPQITPSIHWLSKVANLDFSSNSIPGHSLTFPQ